MALYTMASINSGCIQRYNSDTNIWETVVADSASDDDIYEIDGNNKYLMACGVTNGGSKISRKSSDGGATWSDATTGLSSSGATQRIRGICVVSNIEAYCYCPSSTGGAGVQGVFQWNGVTWSMLIDSYVYPNISGAIQIKKYGNDLYIVTKTDSVYLNKWNGTTLTTDSSLPALSGSLSDHNAYSSLQINSNGKLFIFESNPIGKTAPTLRLYGGDFNNFQLLRSHSASHYSIWGEGVFSWISTDSNLYYLYQTYSGYDPTLYISKFNTISNSYSDTLLCSKAGYGICGKNDNDIMVLSASNDGTWDSGPGYCQYWNGSSWTTKERTGFTWIDSYGIFNGIWCKPEAIENKMKTEKKQGESYSRYIASGDIGLDDYGSLMRDYSPESRCTFRLLCRRGKYWVDPTLGSRLHTIKTLKDAKRKVAAYVDESLKPLVSEGTILGATIGEYYEDPINGMLAVQILINVPSATQPVDLGLIPLGRL